LTKLLIRREKALNNIKFILIIETSLLLKKFLFFQQWFLFTSLLFRSVWPCRSS